MALSLISTDFAKLFPNTHVTLECIILGGSEVDETAHLGKDPKGMMPLSVKMAFTPTYSSWDM